MMAKAELTIKIADLKEYRLFLWRLEELRSRMALVNDPFAEDLDRILQPRPTTTDEQP